VRAAMKPGVRRLRLLRTTVIAARLWLGLFFKIRVTGLENIPDSSPFVLLPKHQRWEDIPLLGISVRRPLYYVAKVELFHPAPVGAFLSSVGGIPLNRERPIESRRHLRQVVEHLRAGEGIVIFPEGTYRPNCMGPGHPGLIRMVSARTSPPFIPVGIRYTPGFRTGVAIRVGKPVRAVTARETAAFLEKIMGEIGRLSGL